MQNEVVVEREVMVTMRDGIQLACDVYRPARDGQPVTGAFPVILERTPYDKGAVSRSEMTAREPKEPKRREEVAAFFTRHGYVVIYQDCRGRYGSEGVFRKYLDEAADGYDTCAWIVQQPWCNGRIGTMGLSYAAHTQAALASLNPPGLAAMFIDSGGFSNAYQSGIRQGGAYLNFNTGEPEGLSTHARIATNSVYVGASRPSHVLLSMISMEAYHG